jgi:hypothetical protein
VMSPYLSTGTPQPDDIQGCQSLYGLGGGSGSGSGGGGGGKGSGGKGRGRK